VALQRHPAGHTGHRGVLAEDVLAEQPGEAVDRVGRCQQGAPTLIRRPYGRRSGHHRLAHPALAPEEHVFQRWMTGQVAGHGLGAAPDLAAAHDEAPYMMAASRSMAG